METQVLRDWNINVDADRVLRVQGADPKVIRQRSPAAASASDRAVEMGAPLLEPVVAYRRLRVRSVKHERLVLEGGGVLTGKSVANPLASAQFVMVVVCTIGGMLEQYASAVMPSDPALGLALDALGSAAVDALTIEACNYIGKLAAAQDMEATIPFSPGMEGWPVEVGQPQLFALLDPAEAGVQVLPSGMMIPQKSLSLVVGIGEEVDTGGRVCDYCSLRDSCRFQDTYA